MNNDYTYATKEIANKLSVEPVTVRKYAQLLEDKGYIFKRNEANKRIFSHDDLKALEYFVSLRQTGKSVEESAEYIASLNRSNLTVSPNDTAIQDEPFLHFIKQQEAFNMELLKRLDKQQEYIEMSLKKRDEQLMIALKETLETKQLIAAGKKRWWQFWK